MIFFKKGNGTMGQLTKYGNTLDSNVEKALSSLKLRSIFIELNDVPTLLNMVAAIRKTNIWVIIGIIDATIYQDIHGNMLKLLRGGATIVFNTLQDAITYHTGMISLFFIFSLISSNCLFFFVQILFLD